MTTSYRDKLVAGLPPTLRTAVERRIARDEKAPKIRKFHLNRERDESGVSGTGIVAVGVVLPSGRAIIEWVSKRTKADSLGIYDDIEDVDKVHGHDGATKIVFDEEE